MSSDYLLEQEGPLFTANWLKSIKMSNKVIKETPYWDVSNILFAFNRGIKICQLHLFDINFDRSSLIL